MMSLFIKREIKAIQPTWLSVERANCLLKPNNGHRYARTAGIQAHCILLNCFNSVTVKNF